MKTATAAFFLAVGLASLACAQQPTIDPGGIVNVASYAPAGLPGSAIAQGSIFTVFGANLGPATLQSSGAFPLKTTLGQTSIKVTAGGVTTDAVPLFTSAGQVAAILPSAAATGAATLTVTYNGHTSDPVPFQIATSSFGAFTSNAAGSGPAAVTDSAGKLNTLTNAFNPGDTAVLYGTGLGPVAGNETAQPLPGDLPSVPVEVYVGTQKATVVYRGRSGCCAALDQINFIVPDVAGCRVPLAVKIDTNISNFTTISIAPAGSRTCSDATGPTTSDLQKYLQSGVSVGAISLTHVSSDVAALQGIVSVEGSVDIGSAAFFKFTPAILNAAQNPFNTFTTGACTVASFKGAAAPLIDPLLPKSLDAGASINITGPNGSKALPRTSDKGITLYNQILSSTPIVIPGLTPPGFLSPGLYTATGPGGVDIGPFTVSLTIPPSVKWTNQDAVKTITRSQGQLITWTGGDPNGSVQITGFSTTGLDAGAHTVSFTCTAKASDGQFTIPPVVLLSLPQSAVVVGSPTGILLVGSLTVPKRFTASGLDAGVLLSTADSAKNLNYQ